MGKKAINRREFLQAAGLVSLGYALPQFFFKPGTALQEGDRQNVLLIVFDAWSAYHLPFLGYARDTTPHLNRLLEKAIVYHNHYAGGNFTTPGTASLLTGTLPWTHRAMGFPNATVAKEFERKNIFHAFQDYHRFAYSHNPLANNVMRRFFGDIDDFTPRQRLFLESDFLVDTLLSADEDTAALSWTRAIKQQPEGFSYSLYFSRLYGAYIRNRFLNLRPNFPRGLPNFNTDNFFLLEDSIDWLQNISGAAPQPFLGYYHFLPPHAPYHTRQDFFGQFAGDGYRPPDKPVHLFRKVSTKQKLIERRTWYDEFILYVDAEFNRLYQALERGGLLENTWLVLTSDHGELFERGILGHSTPVLYQPVIRIPLVIFPPGQRSRQDVFEKTSAIDVLPTLLSLAGREVPGWIEGRVMPPFASPADPEPGIYVIESEETGKEQPITQGTVMLVRGNFKLMYFFGYEQLQGDELTELYDIEADPEELHDLSTTRKDVLDELLGEARAKIAAVNQPYL